MTKVQAHISLPETVLKSVDEKAEERFMNRSEYFKWLHTEYIINQSQKQAGDPGEPPQP